MAKNTTKKSSAAPLPFTPTEFTAVDQIADALKRLACRVEWKLEQNSRERSLLLRAESQIAMLQSTMTVVNKIANEIPSGFMPDPAW